MSVGGVFVLGQFLLLFDLYQLCSGVHSVDVPGHICHDGDGKSSFSIKQLQGLVVWGLLCCTVLQQISTEEKHLVKK